MKKTITLTKKQKPTLTLTKKQSNQNLRRVPFNTIASKNRKLS